MGLEFGDLAAHRQHRREDAERRVGPVSALAECEWQPGSCGQCVARLGEPASGRLDDGPCLQHAFLELGARVGPGGDSPAGADPDPVAADLERPDRHVQLEARHRARVADRARVGLAPGRLELGYHAHRLDLGRTGDRAGRERRAQQLGVADSFPKRALDARHQVPDAGRRARRRQLRHADAAVLAHAPEVVPHEVDDHHVLGAVLDRLGERGPCTLAARRGPLDRLRQDLAAATAQEELGGEAAEGAPGAADEGGVAWGERPRRAREQVGRVALEARVEPQADVRLEDLTGRDPLAAGLDGGKMPGSRRAARA